MHSPLLEPQVLPFSGKVSSVVPSQLLSLPSQTSCGAGTQAVQALNGLQWFALSGS